MGIVYSGVVLFAAGEEEGGGGGEEDSNEIAEFSKEESSDADDLLRFSFFMLMIEPLGECLSVASAFVSK